MQAHKHYFSLTAFLAVMMFGALLTADSRTSSVSATKVTATSAVEPVLLTCSASCGATCAGNCSGGCCGIPSCCSSFDECMAAYEGCCNAARQANRNDPACQGGPDL
mgnify:CR=1 FL=1